MRLFFDSNVLFTAAYNPGGKASLMVELAIELHWELVTSGFAAEEARRNLQRKFPSCLGRLEQLLERFRSVASPQRAMCPVDLPEKDRPILAAAIKARAAHLLTGDRAHFGRHMGDPERTGGVHVCTVSDFLRSL